MSPISRRAFLQSTAAATLAAHLPSPVFAQAPAQEWPENGVLIPDSGWRLWLDPQAEWKNDTIYLPADVSLDKLPVNPPSGGWDSLRANSGREVILPTTVEQHFWGHSPARPSQRPYTPDEYRYAADDPIPQNGAYLGVSWWHRAIDIPAEMQGRRIFLHIRGARLRAEVYLNQKLVGYSIMEELPFECDLTHVADPGGLNVLAIRITNPFGRYDWVDGLNAQWGAVKLYRSHGFGGLDRGMTLSAHDSVRISDLWVLNKPQSGAISAHAQIESPSGLTDIDQTLFEIVDPRTGNIVAQSGNSPLSSPAPQAALSDGSDNTAPTQHASVDLSFASSSLWDIPTPVLYHLRTTVKTRSGHTDIRTIPFGFRWFAPSGLGTDAIFRLNGRRIKLYSAISWGYWGLNGLFPVPELALREVNHARELNLNCLNFHRNVGHEEVFRAHDTIGLLRYMEPGGGKMAIGKLPPGAQSNAPGIVMQPPSDTADKFAQQYMIAKCVGMVRAFRSHPSLIQYTLQNEIGADLSNPDTLAVLEAMRAEDPSRSIVLNDGFVAPPRKAAQAWFEPYNPKLHRSDQEEWGGWWNQHQGAGDQWYDRFYKSPTDFTYRSPIQAQLSEFGEMEGCATPDNHSLMIHQITDTFARYGGDSYDLDDHQEILAAYDGFLDQWGFRKAFPATEQLWLSLGRKCYDTWQNYLENARISDVLDFAVISGWETTSIENHSGIVDNLRNFKSDPAPISATLLPIRPVAKQRAICIALGSPATFDLFLLNDTPQAAEGILTFAMITPSGTRVELANLPAPPQKTPQAPDQFSFLVHEAFTTPSLTEQGLYRFKFSLSSAPLSTHTREIWVADTQHPQSRPLTIAISGITDALRTQLSSLPGVTLADFVTGTPCDLIVCSGLTPHTSARQEAGDETGLEAPPANASVSATTAPPAGHLAPEILEAVRAGTPLLAIPQTDTLSDGVAKQLASAGAFTYNGTVGDFRAPWMGNWYFVRQHPIYEGLPVNQAMGIHYQASGRQSNGLLIDGGPSGGEIQIVAAYSRDHDRRIGAGTFTCTLGTTRILYHRVPDLHPVLQQRLLANMLLWLTTKPSTSSTPAK